MMYEEAVSTPWVIKQQAEALTEVCQQLGAQLQRLSPALVLTVARGSSDHAATYFAYLAMQCLGIPVVSLPLSLLTLYSAPLKVNGQLALAISQSGQSPDLVTAMRLLRDDGATTLALVNQVNSPLAQESAIKLLLCAGPENSVAATKSYIASLSALARMVAVWARDQACLQALDKLPEQLEEAIEQDWSAALTSLMSASRLMVVGRGLGLAIAQEAALKFKETCQVQAEAFSGAEIQHGPMALITQGYPLLIFAPRGPEQAGLLQLAEQMRHRGANVILAAPKDIIKRDLTLVTAAHPTLDPLLAIQSFYVMVARLSVARGLNPDQPPHLSKVTCTR